MNRFQVENFKIPAFFLEYPVLSVLYANYYEVKGECNEGYLSCSLINFYNYRKLPNKVNEYKRNHELALDLRRNIQTALSLFCPPKRMLYGV